MEENMIHFIQKLLLISKHTCCNQWLHSGFLVKKHKVDLSHTVTIDYFLDSCLLLHKLQSWVSGYKWSVLYLIALLLFLLPVSVAAAQSAHACTARNNQQLSLLLDSQLKTVLAPHPCSLCWYSVPESMLINIFIEWHQQMTLFLTVCRLAEELQKALLAYWCHCEGGGVCSWAHSLSP
jgi:hypothetical protein